MEGEEAAVVVVARVVLPEYPSLTQDPVASEMLVLEDSERQESMQTSCMYKHRRMTWIAMMKL